ncbi:hypothetical protein C8J56DRAFT_1081438 [Mycena floridula]|nr:hypothetical protein C8J56DRAFT_1081438 [Mycena floridula]
MHTCNHCARSNFPNSTAVRRHQAQAPACKKAQNAFLEAIQTKAIISHTEPTGNESDASDLQASSVDDNWQLLSDNDQPLQSPMVIDSPPSDAPVVDQTVDDPDAIAPNPFLVTMEEVPDEGDGGCFVESFPEEFQAGATFGEARTTFDTIRDDQIMQNGKVLGPFRDDDEWQLAKWLIKNVGHTQTDHFLKLPIIQSRVAPSFETKDKLLDMVDNLPQGVAWQLDEDGNKQTEELEIWYRDPVEVICELVGNPMFKEVIRYAPEKVYEDEKGEKRIIDEMWTGDWWSEIQKRLPEGATVAPYILSSDKTKLSVFHGDKAAWPVYLTIGNISKEVRRQASSYATILIGYLPIPKFDCFSKGDTRKFAKYKAFHKCMKVIMKKLETAGREGVDMACGDRLVRWIFPILAAYVADYPEQCLVACCMENRCPVCKVAAIDRGSSVPSEPREKLETAQTIAGHMKKDRTVKQSFEELGLRPIFPPFWADLPHSDIFQSFTPDLLHQIHKGVFKDHLVQWVTNLVGKAELDARFKAMSWHPDLRHFKNGISTVSQWTGNEHKAMEKVRVITAVKAALDFIYYASFHSHTVTSLNALKKSLADFHSFKDVFIELGARKALHFNIPKIHSIIHYPSFIRRLGSLDGYNTESPERLHIDYAKNAYHASNKKDYTIQMTNWLRRQEAVDQFSAFLQWQRAGSYLPLDSATRPTVIVPPEADSEEIEDDDGDDGAIFLATVTKESPAYTVAKTHSVSLQNVSASTFISGHNASRFLPALTSFLSAYNCPIIPQAFNNFNLFKQIVLPLKAIPQAGSKDVRNVVCVTPPLPARGRQAPESAKMDCALVRTDERNDKTAGTSLQGLRLAHIQVIFALPQLYGLNIAHPLAYVEWFTPFASLDKHTGLYTVTPSTRRHQVYGEIITVDRIV